MILPVYVYGDPVLRKVAEPIGPDYPNLKEVLENLWETMYHADGVGLAAPQVGLSIRVFVIDASAGAEEEPALKDFKKTFINPVLLQRGGEPWIMEEGCLSLPEIREDVSRPEMVKIRYQDENFQEFEEEYNGFVARVIQHEYDHLEGVLFIDFLSSLRRKLLRGRLANISLGKVQPHYKIKVPRK
jgi:peptide deformylase